VCVRLQWVNECLCVFSYVRKKWCVCCGWFCESILLQLVCDRQCVRETYTHKCTNRKDHVRGWKTLEPKESWRVRENAEDNQKNRKSQKTYKQEEEHMWEGDLAPMTGKKKTSKRIQYICLFISSYFTLSLSDSLSVLFRADCGFKRARRITSALKDWVNTCTWIEFLKLKHFHGGNSVKNWKDNKRN